MKKLTLLIVFVCSITNVVKSQTNDSPGIPNLKNQQSQQISSLQKTTDSLQIEVRHLVEDKKKKKVEDFVPWILTAIAIFISIMVYRRDVSFRNITFVTESNKMKATDPTIWAFYDAYKEDYTTDIIIASDTKFKINGSEVFEVNSKGKLAVEGAAIVSINGVASKEPLVDSELEIEVNDKIRLEGNITLALKDGAVIGFKGMESKKLEGKIRAYSYYQLNSFELVFNYNAIAGVSNTIWEDYMINSMIDSSFFYKIVDNESEGYLYNQEYRNKLKDFMLITRLCKNEERTTKEKQEIIASKDRLLLAFHRSQIKEDDCFSKMQKYMK